MNTRFTRSVSKLAGAFCAAAVLVAASPVLANTSANAAAADVTEPVRDLQDNEFSNSDERFSELFASWSALDTAAPETPGAPIEITGFVRFQLGEGIEKEESDFAAEVAAAVKG